MQNLINAEVADLRVSIYSIKVSEIAAGPKKIRMRYELVLTRRRMCETRTKCKTIANLKGIIVAAK